MNSRWQELLEKLNLPRGRNPHDYDQDQLLKAIVEWIESCSSNQSQTRPSSSDTNQKCDDPYCSDGVVTDPHNGDLDPCPTCTGLSEITNAKSLGTMSQSAPSEVVTTPSPDGQTLPAIGAEISLPSTPTTTAADAPAVPESMIHWMIVDRRGKVASGHARYTINTLPSILTREADAVEALLASRDHWRERVKTLENSMRIGNKFHTCKNGTIHPYSQLLCSNCYDPNLSADFDPVDCIHDLEHDLAKSEKDHEYYEDQYWQEHDRADKQAARIRDLEAQCDTLRIDRDHWKAEAMANRANPEKPESTTPFAGDNMIVETMTFDQLVEHGQRNGANIVNGMPWSWNLYGHPITHENDDCYLIPTHTGTVKMCRNDTLVRWRSGHLSVVATPPPPEAKP